MPFVKFVPVDETTIIRLNLTSHAHEIEPFVENLYKENLKLVLVERSAITLIVTVFDYLRVETFRRKLAELFGLTSFDLTGLTMTVDSMDYYVGVAVEIEPYPFHPEEGWAVHFELVHPEELLSFLSPHGTGRAEEYKDPIVKQVLSAYRDGGLAGARFQETKAHLLGAQSALDYYLLVPAVACDSIQVGFWYEITLKDEEEEGSLGTLIHTVDATAKKPFGTDQTIPMDGVCRELRNPSLQDPLRALYAIGDTPSSAEESCQWGNGIDATTKFRCAAVYNMGQALCVGLVDHTGALAGCFDFGVPYVGRGAKTDQAPQFATVSHYLNGLAATTRIPVVLSHWHMDHCIMAKAVAGELNHTNWIAPREGIGPAAQQIRALIETNHGTVITVKTAVKEVKVWDNPNLQYGKINPENSLARHLHHHGIYLRMTLENGHTIFLAGDCTYAAVAERERTNKGVGYTYLQASHHGGEYALRPVIRARKDIPSSDGSKKRVVFSAGPFSTYGHPSSESVDDYIAQGWTAQHNTHVDTGIDLD